MDVVPQVSRCRDRAGIGSPGAGKVVRAVSQHEAPSRNLVATLASLTVVSGLLDGVTFLGLGHVFVANMTGNVVLIGFAAAGAKGFSVAASLTALVAFLAGAVVSGRVSVLVTAVRRLLLVAMIVEGVLTGVAAVVAAAVPAADTGWPRFTIIAVLAFSVGMRNAAVQRTGVPDMTTTVLTSTLTRLASESTLAGGSNPNVGPRTTSVACMFAGAIAGAVLVLHVDPAWPLALSFALVAFTVVGLGGPHPLRVGSPA